MTYVIKGEMMNWLQIKDAWRDINFYDQRYKLHLKATADSGTVTISSCSSPAHAKEDSIDLESSSIVLSKDDLVELGRFLKPFVDEVENNGT